MQNNGSIFRFHFITFGGGIVLLVQDNGSVSMSISLFSQGAGGGGAIIISFFWRGVGGLSISTSIEENNGSIFHFESIIFSGASCWLQCLASPTRKLPSHMHTTPQASGLRLRV